VITGHFVSTERREKCNIQSEKTRNIRNDHGLGSGGTTVDFAMQYFSYNVSEALQRILFFTGKTLLKIHHKRAVSQASKCNL
jgi:hypothetical protein